MRQSLVVMGPAGSGKTLIGSALAAALQYPFVEGDSFHTAENVALMTAGIPLTDDDRLGWLLALADQLHTARTEARSMVVSCSALKRRYRDLLRSGDDSTCFIYLSTDVDQLRERLQARTGHYMPATLLDSQLDALQPPGDDECAMTIDAGQTPAAIVATILARLPAMFRTFE